MNDRDLTPAESAVLVLDEAENLIWALLDDQLDEAETTASLPSCSKSTRRCVAGTSSAFNCTSTCTITSRRRDAQGNAANGTPILPNLMPGGVVGRRDVTID